VIAGAIFGPILGTLYALAGSIIGAVISFLIARFLGRNFIETLVGRQIVICCECSESLLTKIIFISRLLPLISFDVVSYGAGLTRISLRNFALATLLGYLPLTLIYHTFGSVIRVGSGVALTFALLIVASLFFVPYLVERFNFTGLKKFRPRFASRSDGDVDQAACEPDEGDNSPADKKLGE
jgi:uncharacterized membrane protein YdjX (TVP38/TMEM64 family)